MPEKLCKTTHRGPPLLTTTVVLLQKPEEEQDGGRQGIATDIAMIRQTLALAYKHEKRDLTEFLMFVKFPSRGLVLLKRYCIVTTEAWS